MMPDQQIAIAEIKRKLSDFELYKDTIDREQIKFPLDKDSKVVSRLDLLVPTGMIINTSEIPPFSIEYLEVGIHDVKYLVTLIKQN